jgi:hypothetical protein
MALQRTLGSFVFRDNGPVRVVARADDSADKTRKPPDPEVGARWGAPAQFEFSTTGILNGLGDIIGDIWVDIVENNDNPPTRRKTINAGLQISRGEGRIAQDCQSWTRSSSRGWYYVPTAWSIEWTEVLPKKYLGQIGAPVRRTSFNMSGASQVIG